MRAWQCAMAAAQISTAFPSVVNTETKRYRREKRKEKREKRREKRKVKKREEGNLAY